MNLLTIDELEKLKKQICPNCGYSLDYDNKYLQCPLCHHTWNYHDFKICNTLYKQNPQDYIIKLKNNK